MRTSELFSLLLLTCVLVACGGNRNEAMDNVQENAGKLDDEEMIGANNSGDITITPMPATTEFAEAGISEWVYEGGKFTYETTGYEFGQQTEDAEQLMCANSGKGQHIHLIVNNEPYIAKYEPTFDMELPDGEHHILTFLSRSYHEAIKSDAAHRAVLATVANNGFSKATDIDEPMLFYSRPKGTYTGKKETENVMLDFYPVNADLGGEYHIKATVNGSEEFDITEWQPYYLKGLPMGENTVELALMKGKEVVDAPLNPVTRKFTLEALPAEAGK